MNKNIEKLLAIENEKEFLKVLKENPQLKKEWDVFVVKDEKKTVQFIRSIQQPEISDEEYILYITGQASVTLIEKIETHPEYQSLIADFNEEVKLSEEDNRHIEKILNNVQKSVAKSPDIISLKHLYRACFSGLAADSGEPNPMYLQELFKKSPCYFKIPEKDYPYKLNLFFNNKPAVLQIDLRDQEENVSKDLLQVNYKGKYWKAQDGICCIPLRELPEFNGLEFVILIKDQEKKISLGDLQQDE